MGLVGIFTYMNGGFFMVNVGIIQQSSHGCYGKEKSKRKPTQSAFVRMAIPYQKPAGIYLICGRDFMGFHTRFRDVSRGGIRCGIGLGRFVDEACCFCLCSCEGNMNVVNKPI